MENIKKLREEFESLRDQISKSSQNCDTCEEEFPDYVIEITTMMLSPARCGIYFSKKDIQAISLECNETISLKQRQTMLTHLLKSIFEKKQMSIVFESIKNHIEHKISYYDELSDNFEHSSEMFDQHKSKARAFKNRLDKILNYS